MKTFVRKFLLIAAIGCGVLAARHAAAQPGGDSYVIMVRPGTNLIANHLDSGDNTLHAVLPFVVPGSQLLKWDEASQTFHTDYYADPLVGWTDSTGLPSTTTLGSREAAFLVNPGPTYPLTISGNPRTNSPPPPLARGVLHYVSSPIKAIATMADFRNRGTNFPTDPNDVCTIFLRWNPGSQTWLTNMFSDCHWSLGEPTADIGEGVALWLPLEAKPLVLCPPNLTVFGCDPETPVHYRASHGTNRWISCFPPSGTLFTIGTHPVTCTATNECGEILANRFHVTVRPPVTQWPWPSPLPGIGIPVEPVGGATVVYPPAGSSSTGGPALEFIPNATVPGSGIRLKPGPAQAITFTTVLDFDAPEGSSIDLAVPAGDPLNPTNALILSLKKGTNKTVTIRGSGFGNNPNNLCAIAVNTNGHLLPSVEFTPSEVLANGIAVIGAQPGVSKCHITIELNLLDGGMKLEWDGPMVPSAARKGWDGCIYGPDRPVKKAQARLYVGPPPFPGIPPITELYVHATGLNDVVVIEDASTTQNGRKWGDGHVTLMKAYDDGSTERGVAFTPLADGGGVTIDLGYTASFDVALRRFENGDVPSEEQLLTRTIGPIRGLTNRPPPPFLDAMLLKAGSTGVECSVDFSNLGSPTVRVQIFDHGTLVTQRAGVPATLGNPILTLPDWPVLLGKLGGATPCRRGKPPIFGAFILPGGPGLPPEVVMGDEFRVLAELAPAAPHPDFYSGFEILGSAGATWGVSQLQTTSTLTPQVCSPVRLSPDTVTFSGATEGFLYIGAESLLGPYYELGTDSPTMPTTSPMRVIRLRESSTIDAGAIQGL